MKALILRLKKHQFLFEELVKRDFKKKYKRTVLGMLWSVLSPLLQLLVMSVVFTKFFGRNMEHYTIYLFTGNLLFSFFKESTVNGMHSLMQNAGIIKKINLPKYFSSVERGIILYQFRTDTDHLLPVCSDRWCADYMAFYSAAISHCIFAVV